MNQHIDVKRITDAVYIEDQSNLKLEFPVHSDSLYLLESGGKRKIFTDTCLFNIPKTHYVLFRGINTNISVTTLSEVVHPDKCGVLVVDAINSSLEEREIPRNLQLGFVCIKKYSWFTEDVMTNF